MAKHKDETCTHRLVECRAGCGLFVQARSRNGHELSQCRLVMCSCGKMVLTQSLPLHQQRECRNKMVVCRVQGCGMSMPSQQRERHERHECAMRITSCPACGQVKHAADMAAHVATECAMQSANAAVSSAMRSAFSPPLSVATPIPTLNAAAIRGPPVAMAPPSPPRLVVPSPSQGSLSPDKLKLDALRERVLARRPVRLSITTEASGVPSSPSKVMPVVDQSVYPLPGAISQGPSSRVLGTDTGRSPRRFTGPAPSNVGSPRVQDVTGPSDETTEGSTN